jgi:GntR family transcriptional regulator/MocR family aminotransferase
MKASSGIELMVSLDRDSAVGLRAQLEHQLRERVRSGTLRHGAALPSTRALARELGVARGVVMEAYAQLAAEGYLVSSQGAPTRVAARAATPAAPAAPAEPVAPRFDFRPGAPDVSLFPRAAWAAALRQALRDAPDARFSYSDPRGTPELRGALATYLGRVRGVAAEPETVMVTSGLTQGLVLTCRALAARGVRRVAVEDPGSADLRAPIAAVGLEWVPIAVDGDGIDVGALERSDVRAVLVTPAHQYPTGVVLAPERRAALLAWAAARDAFVLEDDYDAEYRYDRQPIGALQGVDPDRVAYMSSISKTLAPALRIGWLVAPPALAAATRHEKLADDRGTPVITQLGLAVTLERGEFDRHVRSSRLVYRRRRDALIDALGRHLPELRGHGAAAGLHLLVDLPADLDEGALVAAAQQRGVGLDALAPHTARPHGPAIILGYGRIAEPAIELGVRALAAAIGAASGDGAQRS